MHVLMTADTVGGVWTYTKELVTGLLKRGHRITLVSFGKLPCTWQISWMRDLEGLDYRPTPFALEWMQNSAEDIEVSARYLREVIHETEPDLIHLNQYAYGALEIHTPKIIVAHSDVVSWWLAVKGELPPENDWTNWYRDTVRLGLSGADLVVAPSRCMLQNVRTHYLPSVRGEVVYNGRDPSLFNARAEKHDEVVSVGRLWDEAKQVRLLTEQPLPIPVTIVGSQAHPDPSCKSEGAHNGGKVRYCGPQSEAEISELFAHASIYAACSCYEPFGLAPVEAAFSGCALVLNDIPTFRELWGDAALYFKANDASSLADAIGALNANAARRRAYANRAHELACSKFSASGMVNRYEQLYGAVIPQEAAA